MNVSFSRFERRRVMFLSPLYVVPVVLLVGGVLITATVKILREYERAVVFTLWSFQKVKGPGLLLLMPFVKEMVRMDLRIQVIGCGTKRTCAVTAWTRANLLQLTENAVTATRPQSTKPALAN
jgi:regulator of protease activity HflC (stomatin/prohibitin superfamily)